MPIEHYQFIECKNQECLLRFPGVEDISCPICKSETKLVGTRAKGYDGPTEKNDHSIELFLDNIRSAFNVGSIIRTAEGAGVKKIHLAGITPTPEHPSVLKTSLGAEKNILWEKDLNSVRLAQRIIENKKELWSLERVGKSKNVSALPKEMFAKDSSMVLVVGNEVTGIDPELLDLSAQVLHIPMVGEKISLNVATATGIALFALLSRV